MNVYMRAKKKAATTIKSALRVILGVSAELQRFVSQQTLAMTELALTYERKEINVFQKP